jgi:hypothetical protein
MSQSQLSLSFYQAAENGHEAAVQQLLANDQVDVNPKDFFGQTPLSRAAENGHEAVVKLLLANDQVDVNTKDNYGRTPLLRAAAKGHEAVVKLLLANDQVDVNPKDPCGRTPLSRAAENGHEAVVQLLLENDQVNVNTKLFFRQTPLSLAAEKGHEAVVKRYIVLFLVFLARRFQLNLSLHRLSEFPNRLRPPCTTMPWNIRPALFVLWGVCWMFYTPPTTPQPDQSHAIWYSEPLNINPGKYSHVNSFYNHFVLKHS